MDIAQKTKQEWPDSGSTLENIFLIFTNLIPRRIFFLYYKKFLVLMVPLSASGGQESEKTPFGKQRLLGREKTNKQENT